MPHGAGGEEESELQGGSNILVGEVELLQGAGEVLRQPRAMCTLDLVLKSDGGLQASSQSSTSLRVLQDSKFYVMRLHQLGTVVSSAKTGTVVPIKCRGWLAVQICQT